jgi:short-subunit dehydrogenase
VGLLPKEAHPCILQLRDFMISGVANKLQTGTNHQTTTSQNHQCPICLNYTIHCLNVVIRGMMHPIPLCVAKRLYMSTKKVWFVTGASKGLGLSLVKKLLQEGYAVAATSRTVNNLTAAVGAFNQQQLLPLEVNLADAGSITKAIQQTVAHFGKIDVVVNNAGYGIGGAVEELSEKEIQQSFDVNVFAVIKVMQAVMPYFRKQRSGYIINISSIAGFAPATGWAMYAATKYAVMGVSEVMAEDVKELGVHVTVVAPGGFRTAFLNEESLVYSANTIDEYTGIRASHKRYAGFNGLQQGDPDKAAAVFIQLAEMPNPPARLYLGSDAYNRAKAKIELLTSELEANKGISFSTDYI